MASCYFSPALIISKVIIFHNFIGNCDLVAINQNTLSFTINSLGLNHKLSDILVKYRLHFIVH